VAMGGKTAQLAFQYQNIITVLRTLEVMRDGTCISVEIEKEIRNYNKKELDIVIELKENISEFYEVKSGLQFTNSNREIKDTIKKFLRILSQKEASAIHRYYIIINPEYLSPIAQVIANLKKIKERRKGYRQIVQRICDDWNISDVAQLQDLSRVMTIKSENNLIQATRLCKEVIRETIEDMSINTDHALTIDDLLNRLICILIESLKNNGGKVDLFFFAAAIIDWLTRNRVAYSTSHNHDVEQKMKEERYKIAKELQSKFTSIDFSALFGVSSLTSDQF
jgi:hypothetical protein